MPRLSVFSWDGTDTSDINLTEKNSSPGNSLYDGVGRWSGMNQKEKEKWLANYLRNPKTSQSKSKSTLKNAKDINNKSSLQFIDQTWKRPTMQLYLRITATSEKRDITKGDLEDVNFIKPEPVFPYTPTSNNLLVKQDGTCHRQKRHLGHPITERFWLKNLQISDFRPLKAPFVPDLIRILVVSIETFCKTNSWNIIFEPWKFLLTKAQKYAILLINEYKNIQNLKHIINKMNPHLRIATLRAFLDGFSIKPLHLSSVILKQLIKNPLLDQFLRPNPEIKSIIRRTALPKARTELDTLAFLMTHIIHCWESSSNPFVARTRLAEIYGPLLISFSDRPIIIDQNIGPAKTEEAVLMEVILDLCDAPFWNHLSMLRIGQAFYPIELAYPVEEDEEQTNPDLAIVPLPEIRPYLNLLYVNEKYPYHKKLKLRSTGCIVEDLRKIRLGYLKKLVAQSVTTKS